MANGQLKTTHNKIKNDLGKTWTSITGQSSISVGKKFKIPSLVKKDILRIEPAHLDFGVVKTSRTLSLKIYNDSDSTVGPILVMPVDPSAVSNALSSKLSGSIAANDFQITKNNQINALIPGEKADVDIIFSPSMIGPQDTTVIAIALANTSNAIPISIAVAKVTGTGI